MANAQHLEILGRGVSLWNKWRMNNPSIRPDLSGALLAGQDLQKLDLRLAKLDRAILSSANLKYSDLSGSSLTYADLSFTDLTRTDLHRVDFSNANLVSANMHRANLRGSVLRKTRLTKANLTGAYFDPSILNEADLSGSILHRATFVGARMIGVKLKNARLWETVIADTDLTNAQGLEDCQHDGPSTIDLRTIARSKTISDSFLKGCGLPDSFIEYLPSFINQPIQYYSCFISYSHNDHKFATRLYNRLQYHGIRCWLDDHQMLPGDDIYEQIDRGIRMWDKVLLCCTKESLSSWWIDNEIDIAFSKERDLMNGRGEKVLSLIPINVDGYVFNAEWKSGKRQQILSRLVANFTEWEVSQSHYEKQVMKIVKALRFDSNVREKPPIRRL